MKTWRERVAEAEGRAASPWWRRIVCACCRVDGFGEEYPFTRDDRAAWRGITTCPAGEAVSAYGLAWWQRSGLYDLGSDFLWEALSWVGRSGITHNTVRSRLAAAHRILDAIEDRALALKREQAG